MLSFFLAFYDKAGHNFVSIGGMNNFDKRLQPQVGKKESEIATTD